MEQELGPAVGDPRFLGGALRGGLAADRVSQEAGQSQRRPARLAFHRAAVVRFLRHLQPRAERSKGPYGRVVLAGAELPEAERVADEPGTRMVREAPQERAQIVLRGDRIDQIAVVCLVFQRKVVADRIREIALLLREDRRRLVRAPAHVSRDRFSREPLIFGLRFPRAMELAQRQGMLPARLVAVAAGRAPLHGGRGQALRMLPAVQPAFDDREALQDAPRERGCRVPVQDRQREPAQVGARPHPRPAVVQVQIQVDGGQLRPGNRERLKRPVVGQPHPLKAHPCGQKGIVIVVAWGQLGQLACGDAHTPRWRQHEPSARAAESDQADLIALLVRVDQERERRGLREPHSLARAHRPARIDTPVSSLRTARK